MNVFIWIVFVLAFIALALVIVSYARARRVLQRQLGDVAARLDDAVDGRTAERLESVLGQLEQAAHQEREHAEAADSARRRFELALDATTDGVVVVDVNGDVVMRNGPAGRFHDARHADAIAAEAIQQLLDAARRGEAGQREVQLFGPPRQVLHVRAVPLASDHAFIGAVAFVRDVSENRRVESVRRDFVANVSHELKTPIGALTLLAETIASGEDATVMQQLADRVVKEADRLGRIVDDLLNLSLIEAQESPTREPLPVPLLIGDAMDQVRAAAELAEVPLGISLPIPDVEIVCDRRQVLSALVNLLENAVKYSDPGAAVEISASTDRGRAVVSVRDHGIGIPKRDLERIFERFYRVDRARSRQTGGTGLGLSIVRHVVQAHGGEITVDSVEGEGSTFTLYFPLLRVASPRLSEAS
jgi:two-component system sensor histidine kinase SenX3